MISIFYIKKRGTFVSLNGENHEQKVKLNNYIHSFVSVYQNEGPSVQGMENVGIPT